MLLTRGSHVLTSISLPDASLVLFLLGGLYLKRAGWFAVYFVLAAVIDFGAAALDPLQGFCLTNGYWGLIAAYAAMWLGGRWLATRRDAFALMPYAAASLITTIIAFVISTQTYYLFSGRFPNSDVMETVHYGWNYMPSYLGYTAIYFAMVWVVVRAVRGLNPARSAKA
jgi:hypothetical protein